MSIKETRESQTDSVWNQFVTPSFLQDAALELDTDFEEILLKRSTKSERLGLTLHYYGALSGDSIEVYVSAIHAGGIVEKDGRMQEGDKVLRVNGCDVICKEQVENSVASDVQISFLVARPNFSDETFVRHLGFCPHSKVLQARMLEIKKAVSNISKDNLGEISDPEVDQDKNKVKPSTRITAEKMRASPKLSRSTQTPEKTNKPDYVNVIEKPSQPTSVDAESVHTYESISDWEGDDHIYNIPYDNNLGSKILQFSPFTKETYFESKLFDDKKREGEASDKENKKKEDIERLKHRELSNNYFDPSRYKNVETWLERSAAWQGSPKKNKPVISDLCDSCENISGAKNLGIPRSQARTGLCEIPLKTRPRMIDTSMQVNLESDTLSMISCDSCRKFLLTSPTDSRSVPNSPKRRIDRDRSHSKLQNGCKMNEKLIGVVPTETMYTTAENLEHTIKVQQKLFKQALLMRHFKSKQSSSLTSLRGNSNFLFTYLPKPIYPNLENDKDDDPMEWKVKKRSDGSRYITRRPARNRILKEREQKLIKERPSTDDDSTSELKMGRYWNKDQRRKHAERSRERRKRQEEVIRSASQDRAQDILHLSHKKMEKKKNKKGFFDDFITVQELLVHGKKSGQESLLAGLLSVTTV